MSKPINSNKVVIFTGAGISAESGIQTFRDANGLWASKDPMKIASAKAWKETPKDVIDFHNSRLIEVEKAQPNAAHRAVKELEEHFEVIVITQNVDDLHERAGSSHVFHLHGIVTEVYPDDHPQRVTKRGYRPISMGEVDEEGNQIRPNIVLFGEDIQFYEQACEHMMDAGKVLVVGTSLAVQPAAGMLKKSRFQAEKIIVSLDVDERPFGFQILRCKATEMVPEIVNRWVKEGNLGGLG